MHRTTRQIGTKKQVKFSRTLETSSVTLEAGSVVRVEMDDYVICKETMNSEDQEMKCDLCEGWEHLGCIRQSDNASIT